MKIVIIGGTGLIGSKLTSKLRQLGHEVMAASPDSGVNTITGQGLADGEIHLSLAEIQPISSDDVAAAMADVALGSPANGIVEIAGPETFSLADLAQRYLNKMQDARTIKADPQARYFGALLKTKTLVPAGNARLGKTNFEAWMKTKLEKV